MDCLCVENSILSLMHCILEINNRYWYYFMQYQCVGDVYFNMVTILLCDSVSLQSVCTSVS